MVGTVVSLNLLRGYGFIKCPGEPQDIFFHLSGLAAELPFDAALQERRVQFQVKTTTRGDEAINITPAP